MEFIIAAIIIGLFLYVILYIIKGFLEILLVLFLRVFVCLPLGLFLAALGIVLCLTVVFYQQGCSCLKLACELIF